MRKLSLKGRECLVQHREGGRSGVPFVRLRARRGVAGDRATVFDVRAVEEVGFAGSREFVGATGDEIMASHDRCDDRVCEPCSDVLGRRSRDHADLAQNVVRCTSEAGSFAYPRVGVVRGRAGECKTV